MKTNDSAPQGARLSVVVLMLAIALLSIDLLVSLAGKKPTKLVQPDSVARTPATTPAMLPSVPQVARVEVIPQSKLVNGVAPETEAALEQFGLSATSLVKISVVAQKRAAVVFPSQTYQKTQ